MYIFIIFIVAFALYYSGIFGDKKQALKNNEKTEKSAVEIPAQQWETKTDEQSAVSIEVTPIEIGKDAKTWKFSLVFDTHSGSLDDDPTQVAVLMDDNGNTYQPKAWEGPGPGGHHREGILLFDAIFPAPTSIELKIKNVDNVLERSFTWNMR